MSLKPLVYLNMFRLTLFIFFRERLRPRELRPRELRPRELATEVAERPPDLADLELERRERAEDLDLRADLFLDLERLVEPSLRRLVLF